MVACFGIPGGERDDGVGVIKEGGDDGDAIECLMEIGEQSVPSKSHDGAEGSVGVVDGERPWGGIFGSEKVDSV